LCVNGLGRALGLSTLIRSEDHDRGRARAAFEDAMFADLDWLGLSYVNSREAREKPSIYRQSDNLADYAAALESLALQGTVYGCDCTRKRLAALMPRLGPAAEGQQELVYDGHCRGRGLDWRLPGIGARYLIPPEDVRFRDGFLGDITQNPARQCGDVLLRDRHGNYTYQLAVVVDDLRQKIGVVIRGQDLVASTGRQIILARALGRATPALFAHHPLLTDPSGRKLGKRFFSESLAERRQRGDHPQAVAGEALWRLGLLATPRAVAPDEAAALFRGLFT
jgi:glutamyl-tRNA synthetase/glutamyl-Q tRNA(Asp) synthetase